MSTATEVESVSSPPSVSVVIASAAGEPYLFRCLDSLRGQAAELALEVIVVDRCGGPTEERVQRDYPFVRLVSVDGRPSVPQLRSIGAQQATGDVVAIIEEHCAAAPDWLEAIRRSWRDGDAAIGGPVIDSAYRNPRDWAIYFSEFHNYLPPWAAGPRFQLNGVNIAYSRQLLLEQVDVLDTGYWEVVLHPRLAKNGAFRSVPDMRVHHAGPFELGLYLEQRYLLSRVWGAGQRETASTAKRLFYLVAAVVFPLLLLLRIAARVSASSCSLGWYLVALPWLVPIVCAYVIGEWSGYAFGIGDALERVE